MKKTIHINGQDLIIESNALLPRLYRKEFGRDLMIDMRKLNERCQADPDNIDTEVLENVTWLMLRAAGNDVGNTVEEWLQGMDDIVSLYTAMSDVVDLWVGSQKTTAKPKKK